jgi:hypothetical protein
MSKLQGPLGRAPQGLDSAPGFNQVSTLIIIDNLSTESGNKPSATIIVWKASLDGANKIQAYALFSGLTGEGLKSSCRRAFSYPRRNRDGVK